MTPELLLEDFISRNSSIDREKAKRIINEKFMALFAPHILEYCANYEIVQDKLLSLTPTQLNIISRIIKNADLHNQDWTIPAAEFITLVENPNYQELLASLEGKLLTETEISSLMFLTRNSFNYFSVKDYSDLSRIDEIREAQYQKTKTSESPEIILLNKYGISFNTANKILKRYGKDLELLPSSMEKEFLSDIAHIVRNEGTFEPLSEDIDFLNNMNSRLSNLYTHLYSNELYKLQEQNLTSHYHTEDGTAIPIYDAGVDFTMSIHSIGMAKQEETQNYYHSWNRQDAGESNFCNSIITSRSLVTSVRSCVFGFASYQPNDLKLVAANDLGTGALKHDPIVSKMDHASRLIADVEFRAPSQMDNHTRFTNNEMYRSRRRVVDGKLQKVNPDYLVYLKESYDTDIKSDPVWEETVKASLDYKEATGQPLPIVVVDCERCLQYNVQKLEGMINSFLSNFDDKTLLVNIIELMHTLRYGYNRNKKEIIKKYLDSQKSMAYLDHILKVIIEMSAYTPRLALEHLNTLTESLDSEYAKVNASPYWIEHYCNSPTIDKNPTVYKVIEETKKRILEQLMVKQKNNSNQNKM